MCIVQFGVVAIIEVIRIKNSIIAKGKFAYSNYYLRIVPQ